MTGDADRQPVEGVVTLSDLAAEMDETDAGQEEDGAEVEDEGSEADETDDVGESEGEDDAEDEQQEEPTVTLKHDGKEVTLKQSEVVELAQKGFDYTQKTMAVGEERKAVEAEKAKVSESRQRIDQELQETINRLQAYSQFMETQVGSPPPISLAQQDAASYLAQKELYESRRGQFQQSYSELQRLQHEQAQKRQAWIAEKAAETEKALQDTLPGWNEKSLDELSGYASSMGLDPQVAAQAMLTPGFWQAMHKAKAYDALQEQKAKLKPKTQLAKVQKPSSANQPSRAQAKREDAEKRYRAKPSLDTLSALIE
jgi:hypothetical protein